MEHTPHLCWSCQHPFPEGAGSARSRVWLDELTAAPVCRSCWETIPPAARVDLAIRLMDRGQDGRAVNDVLGLLQHALRQAADRPFDWLRGEGQN